MRKHFNVPLLTYLKKYVVLEFFPHESAPYKIEEDSLLGKQVMSLILDCRQKDLQGDKKKEMTETLQLILSESMAERSPTIYKLLPLNYYLDQLFKLSLRTWVNGEVSAGMRPFNSVKNFLRYYGIDESEYSTEAALQYLHRSKRKKKPQGRPKKTAAVK